MLNEIFIYFKLRTFESMGNIEKTSVALFKNSYSRHLKVAIAVVSLIGSSTCPGGSGYSLI